MNKYYSFIHYYFVYVYDIKNIIYNKKKIIIPIIIAQPETIANNRNNNNRRRFENNFNQHDITMNKQDDAG